MMIEMACRCVHLNGRSLEGCGWKYINLDKTGKTCGFDEDEFGADIDKRLLEDLLNRLLVFFKSFYKAGGWTRDRQNRSQ